VKGDGFRQRQGLLDRLPMLRTTAAVEINLAPHFVIAGLSRGHKHHSFGSLAKLLRVAAFSAARTPQQEGHRFAAV
jgi:hypothetical protein